MFWQTGDCSIGRIVQFCLSWRSKHILNSNLPLFCERSYRPSVEQLCIVRKVEKRWGRCRRTWFRQYRLQSPPKYNMYDSVDDSWNTCPRVGVAFRPPVVPWTLFVSAVLALYSVFSSLGVDHPLYVLLRPHYLPSTEPSSKNYVEYINVSTVFSFVHN